MSDLFEPELSGLERFRRTLNEGGLIERTEVEGTGRSRILAGDLDCGHTDRPTAFAPFASGPITTPEASLDRNGLCVRDLLFASGPANRTMGPA